MNWTVFYTKQAQKDAKKVASSNLKSPQRINIQHRLVYQVFVAEHAVKVLRMWTHYE